MEIGLLPHGAARCSAWQKFVASLSQIPPIGPVLPTQPVYKPFAVYILARDSFHGMEEVIGSIPIRSTNQSLQLRPHSPSGQSFQVVAFDPASTVAWKASGLKLHKLRVPLRRNDKLGSQQTLLLILRNMRPVHDIGNKLRAKRKIDIVAVDIPHLLLIDDE
jgi:hypothetical protein